MQEQTLTQFFTSAPATRRNSAHCDVQKLAEYLNCILQGMSISAREGATFEKLMQIAHNLRLFRTRQSLSLCRNSPLYFSHHRELIKPPVRFPFYCPYISLFSPCYPIIFCKSIDNDNYYQQYSHLF